VSGYWQIKRFDFNYVNITDSIYDIGDDILAAIDDNITAKANNFEALHIADIPWVAQGRLTAQAFT
jgi:hypothetical protein